MTCNAHPVKAVFNRYKAVLSSIKQASFSSGKVAVIFLFYSNPFTYIVYFQLNSHWFP